MFHSQSKLTNMAESITTKLSYFNELDKISQVSIKLTLQDIYKCNSLETELACVVGDK